MSIYINNSMNRHINMDALIMEMTKVINEDIRIRLKVKMLSYGTGKLHPM